MSFYIHGAKPEEDEIIFIVEVSLTKKDAYEIMCWSEPSDYLYVYDLTDQQLNSILKKYSATLPQGLTFYLTYAE